MPMTFVESFTEFYARHDGPGKAVKEGINTLLYPDGAVSDAEHGMLRKEPPADPILLAKARKRYLVLAIRLEEEAFQTMRNQFQEQNEWSKKSTVCPPAPANAVDILLAKKASIQSLQGQLAEVEKTLADSDEAEAKVLREQRDAERLRTVDDHSQRINAVTL